MELVKQIEKIILSYEDKITGELGFGFKDIETGEEFYVNKNHSYPTASTFKIFLLAELFHQIEEGVLNVTDRLILKEEDKVEGSGILFDMDAGASLTLKDYAYLMMSLSDNTATDLLFHLVGAKNIKTNIIEKYHLNQTKCDYDCKDLQYYCFESTNHIYNVDSCYRKLPPFICDLEKNDQTSPADMLKILELTAKNQLISEYVSYQMIDIMEKCQMNNRIPRYLPDSVKVAHKTGSLDRIVNDVGIITTPYGRYILVFYYNGNMASIDEYNREKTRQLGEQLIADISRDIYQIYMENKA